MSKHQVSGSLLLPRAHKGFFPLRLRPLSLGRAVREGAAGAGGGTGCQFIDRTSVRRAAGAAL